MVKSSGDGSLSVAPFLKKCYEMVDDESADSIISWSKSGGADNCFVIWDTTEFSVRLLPKYFKHSNFSSFIRQLNIYGFRKTDTDRWEFANNGFVRGKKHLLKNITRRKNIQGVDRQKKLNKPENSVEELPEEVENSELRKEVENSELRKEVENLKSDRNKLMQELIKLRQHQESVDDNLLLLKDRLQGMEKNQEQMLSFLVMVMQRPTLLVQLLQPKENNWLTAEAGTILQEVTEEGESVPSDLSLVMYQPPWDGLPANSQEPDSNISNGLKDFLINADLMKTLIDENHAPLTMPDLYDDGAWEMLLSASPSKESDKDTKVDEDGNGGDEIMEMGIESDKDRIFELLLQQMENSDDLEAHACDKEKSRYLELLTEQMGLLVSNEKST